MKKIFSWAVLPISDYLWLKKMADRAEEYDKKEREVAQKLQEQAEEKKYADFIGNWFLDEDNNILFKILRVKKSESRYLEEYMFEVFIPNGFETCEEYEIGAVVAGTDFKRLTEQEAREHCGLK